MKGTSPSSSEPNCLKTTISEGPHHSLSQPAVVAENKMSCQLTLIAAYQIEFKPIHLDIRNKDDVFNTVSDLPESFKNIDVLINNTSINYF